MLGYYFAKETNIYDFVLLSSPVGWSSSFDAEQAAGIDQLMQSSTITCGCIANCPIPAHDLLSVYTCISEADPKLEPEWYLLPSRAHRLITYTQACLCYSSSCLLHTHMTSRTLIYVTRLAAKTKEKRIDCLYSTSTEGFWLALHRLDQGSPVTSIKSSVYKPTKRKGTRLSSPFRLEITVGKLSLLSFDNQSVQVLAFLGFLLQFADDGAEVFEILERSHVSCLVRRWWASEHQ